MQTLAQKLTDRFRTASLEAFPELAEASESWPVEVLPSTNPKFGHYQYNSAMKLTKVLKQNPRAIAQAIQEKLDLQDGGRPMVSELEIAGPGFINLTLHPDFLTEELNALAHDSKLGARAPEGQRRVVIDFSSPNIAKEMHVGHLRSTIIGDSLARLFEFLGLEVLRLNHVGDWGTSFGMLIHYLKTVAPDVLSGKQETDLGHLVRWYKESKKKFDEDPEFKKASQLEVVKLQGGDPAARQAWRVICEISRKAFEEVYGLLDVHLEERGESFYNDQLADIVSDFEGKGLVDLSEGAKCVTLEGFTNREGDPLPLMIQKSDGGYLYATTDLAALRHRVEQERADRVIYVTDMGQATHFQMVFQAAKKSGYWDPNKVQLDHVPFGLVLGSDGKKFRTRSGETERLMDLLQAAVDRAYDILNERNADWSEEEKRETAKVLGIGAVKYADLSSNRTSDYVFSYDRMLRFDGNTAAFILYSYVRVNGIKRKCGVDIEDLKKTARLSLQHPSEVALGLHLCQFGEALEWMGRDLLPNRLTDYLFALAEKFNAFFRDCRVEGSDEQSSRLLLCERVAEVLRTGLHILGLNTAERM